MKEEENKQQQPLQNNQQGLQQNSDLKNDKTKDEEAKNETDTSDYVIIESGLGIDE